MSTQSVKSFFKRISKAAFEAKCQQEVESIRNTVQEVLDNANLELIRGEDRRHRQNKLNQQRSRNLRVNAEVLLGKRDPVTRQRFKTTTDTLVPPAMNSALAGRLPQITNPQTQTGKYRKKERKRKNWKTPSLWPEIMEAAQQAAFSTRGIIKYLQSKHRNTGKFDRLSPGTVDDWIEKGDGHSSGKRWKASVLASIESGTCWKPGTGRIRILAQRNDVLDAIRKALLVFEQLSYQSTLKLPGISVMELSNRKLQIY